MPTTLSRKAVLEFLAESSSYGNLGLFVGAGFSKAVLNDNEVVALSWGELLERAAKKMGIDYDSIDKIGVSYPDIASTICTINAEKLNIPYSEALNHLKREIARLTGWYATQKQREKYSPHLWNLKPSWVITTNYDLVIESLLTGKCISLGPNDSLSSPSDVVPVFHLHGVRTNPEEIIISQEDYVSLFRPNQYRQIKLALTIKESTTLLLGYGLGDVNVLTALDWSKNVFTAESQNYPAGVVQVLRKANPQSDPYSDKNGIVILETADLNDFFEEAGSACELLAKTKEIEQEALTKLSTELNAPEDSTVNKFIDDPIYRAQMLKVLSKFSVHLSGGFISFLDSCITETWARSSPNKAFQGYKENLVIILDILTAFPLKSFPPALFQAAVYGLERVGYYVGNSSGKSWAAQSEWDIRKDSLSADTVKELRTMADQYGYEHLKELLKTIAE